MSFVIAAAEYLVIDTIPLSTPAWYTTNMDDVIATSEIRGDDILVPLADGVRPYRRRPTVTAATVELVIVGDTKPDGTFNADHRLGLRQNIETLAALTLADGTAEDGTRLAVLHLAGTTRQGKVHVLRLRVTRDGPAYATAQLELSFPQGAMA